MLKEGEGKKRQAATDPVGMNRGTDEGDRYDESDAADESEEEELILDPEGRVAHGGIVDYSTRCIQDALVLRADETNALLEDSQLVMTARAAGGDGYSAGTTFWVGASSKPRTTLERLALEIFRFHSRSAQFDPASSGVEWWTQVIHTGDDIGFHWDRDYDMEVDAGLLIHPHVATVTYLSTSGAPTLVIKHASPLTPGDSLCGKAQQVHACVPKKGCHLSFDGRMLHGAPSSLSALVDGSSSKGEKRVTFLANIWINHVPWGADPLPKPVSAKISRRPISFCAMSFAVSPHELDVHLDTPCVLRRWRFGYEFELSVPWPAVVVDKVQTKGAPSVQAPSTKARRSKRGRDADPASRAFVCVNYHGGRACEVRVHQKKSAKRVQTRGDKSSSVRTNNG